MMRAQKQAGVALIIVLWIITLLTVIAVSFMHTMRTEVNVVANSLARVKAETLAEAGLQRAIYELHKPQNTEGRWNADGSTREWQYRDITVNITMHDETARIDINRASAPLLRGLLLSQGVVEEDALKLVDAIADWRDADVQKRPRGAEAADYAAAGLNHAPANALFQAVEELKLVLGMTPELYMRLAPLITVYSGQQGFNEQVAERAVLRALPNVSDEQIDDYLSRRDLARASRQPVPVFAQNSFRVASNNLTPTRIRTEAVFADGNTFAREVVVRRFTDPKRPYAFLSWKEGRELAGSQNDATGNIPIEGGQSPAITSNTTSKPGSPNTPP